MSTRRQPFSKFSLVLIFGYGAFSLLFAVVLGFLTDPRAEVESIDTDTFSESALGHGAFAELLDERGYWTTISRWESGAEAKRAGLLVMAEPHVMVGGEPELVVKMQEMLQQSPRTLLVLPKRDGLAHEWDENWIGATMLVPDYDVQHVLDIARVTTTSTRVWRESASLPWQAAEPTLRITPVMPNVQLMRPSAKLEPLIWTERGVLFARVKDGGLGSGELYVLSDPDIIANHGIHEPPNADLAVNIIERTRKPRGRIIIDEILHGHEQVPTLWQQLMRFPLLLGTLQACLLIFFTLWAGVLRFGPARREEDALAAGKQFAIDNTAELLTLGGHSAYMLERYVWMILDEVAFKLNAPPKLPRDQKVAWLQEQANSRGFEINLRALTQEAMVLSVEEKKIKKQKLEQIALEIYRFHEAMIHES